MKGKPEAAVAQCLGLFESLLGLRRSGRHDQHGNVERCEQQAHAWPAPGRGPGDAPAARDQHADAVQRNACAHRHALLVLVQRVDGVGVDGNVLRRC